MIITPEEIRSFNCPICGSSMILMTAIQEGTDVKKLIHRFRCSDEHKDGCAVKWTASGIQLSTE